MTACSFSKRLDSSYRRRGAFTLIELLVVIAIIAILAALLLPSLNRTKQTAELTACRNNVRQVMVAMNLYTTENNFYPMLSNFPGALYPFTHTWWPTSNIGYPSNAIGYYNYLGAAPPSVYVCPAYNRLKGYVEPGVGSYGYNCEGTFYDDADAGDDGNGLGYGLVNQEYYNIQIPILTPKCWLPAI